MKPRSLLYLLFSFLAWAQTPVYVALTPAFVAGGNVVLPPTPPNSRVTLCNYPSNGVPCTNLAVTYSGSSTSIPCPGSAQLVWSAATGCTSQTDSQGHFAFWALPGAYEYTVTTSLGTLGPYFVTAPISGIPSPGPVVNATSFGLVCDGTTVNPSSVFMAINTFLVANDNTTLVFPSNATCLFNGLGVNPLVGPDWLIGVSSASLIGDRTALINTQADGATTLNFQAGGSSFVCYSGTVTNPTLNYDFTASTIQTVAAQSGTITVNTPSSISTWKPGDSLLIYGFDQQGNGFPSNYRYFEHKTLRSAANGVITLDSSLKFGYNANWYYSPPANTTPPAVRNLTRECTGGGYVKRLKHLFVQGFDFSQTIPSQPGQVATASGGGGDYMEFNKVIFAYFYPSDAGTVVIRNSTFQWIEIDKLIDNFYCFNCLITGNQQVSGAAGVTSGSGALYSEFDNSTFLARVNAFPRTFVLNNDTFYAQSDSPYGFIQNNSGYADSITVNNPLLVAIGVNEGGIYGVGGAIPVTVQATPTANTFTVTGTADVSATIQLAGPGAQIKDHATGAILGTVSDVYLNSGILTVSGVWSTAPKTKQVVDLNVNPMSVNVINPIAVDFDINAFPPAYDAATYANVKNLTMQFSQATTVANLGPCNTASTQATKWVKDAASQSVLGPGGGTTTVQVSCQGTGQWGGAWAPVSSTVSKTP